MNTTTVKLQQRGVLTLPKKIRDTLGLEEGQSFKVKQEAGNIVLEPELTLDEHLAVAVKQGIEDIKNGDYIEFGSLKEFDEKIKKYNAG